MIIRDATSKAGGKAVFAAIGKCTVRKHLSSAITRDAHNRSKAKTNQRTHQKQVHLKIKAKSCHVCDRRFYSNQDLRAHMKSQHQTADHDMSKCDDCVIILKKNHRISQARIATLMRQVERNRTHSTPTSKPGPECHEKKVGGIRMSDGENALALKGEQVERQPTRSLNEDLIDVHLDMQLLSSL